MDVLLWTFNASMQMRADPSTRALDVPPWPEPPVESMLACTHQDRPYWYGWLDGARVGDGGVLPPGYYLIPRAA